MVGLTPLIDVVFLLLIFFMLASRFAVETQMELKIGGAGAAYQGPPRLVTVEPNALALNGSQISAVALPAALDELLEERSQIVVLRTVDGVSLQRLVTVMDTLAAAGFSNLVLAE